MLTAESAWNAVGEADVQKGNSARRTKNSQKNNKSNYCNAEKATDARVSG
jgi:hypothetical protein